MISSEMQRQFEADAEALLDTTTHLVGFSKALQLLSEQMQNHSDYLNEHDDATDGNTIYKAVASTLEALSKCCLSSGKFNETATTRRVEQALKLLQNKG